MSVRNPYSSFVSLATVERIADQVMGHLCGESVRHLGDGTAGSVTRPLFTALFPECEWASKCHHRDGLLAALHLLEDARIVTLTRQSDPTHAPGKRTGQVGNKVIYLTVNT